VIAYTIVVDGDMAVGAGIRWTCNGIDTAIVAVNKVSGTSNVAGEGSPPPRPWSRHHRRGGPPA
jgi:hypothetical protein